MLATLGNRIKRLEVAFCDEQARPSVFIAMSGRDADKCCVGLSDWRGNLLFTRGPGESVERMKTRAENANEQGGVYILLYSEAPIQ